MVLAILLGPYLKDIWFFSYSYARIDAVSNLKTIICPSIIETNNQIEGKNNDFYNLSDERNIDVSKPTKKKCESDLTDSTKKSSDHCKFWLYNSFFKNSAKKISVCDIIKNSFKFKSHIAKETAYLIIGFFNFLFWLF